MSGEARRGPLPMVRPIGVGWYQARVRTSTGSTYAKGWLKRHGAAVTGPSAPRPRNGYTPGRPIAVARAASPPSPLGSATVALAQPAEHRTVDPKVTGSTPVGHPNF
jgi:hypothetical protein